MEIPTQIKHRNHPCIPRKLYRQQPYKHDKPERKNRITTTRTTKSQAKTRIGSQNNKNKDLSRGNRSKRAFQSTKAKI
jgi:hypothetical protein